MRLGLDEPLLVFNGLDGEWRARLADVGRRGCALIVERQTRAQEIGPDLELLMAVVKRGRLETIVEKAAELGAARVRLVVTERTNSDRVNLARLGAIAVEAAEQTGRLDVPAILGPESLGDLIKSWDHDRRLMFCDETGDAAPAQAALERLARGPWAVLIGPEGGFSPAERGAVRAMASAVPASLGPRILRADTAAIAALTIWQSALGDWRGLEVGGPAAQVEARRLD